MPHSSTVAKNLSSFGGPAFLTAEVGEPEVGGGEIESGDGVEGDVFLLSASFDLQLGYALDARFAFGEQRDSCLLFWQQRRGRGVRSRRVAPLIDRVEGGSGDFLFALFGGVLPVRGSAASSE